MTHALKTWPEQFKAIVAGEKTFEIRRAVDRTFKVGDTLLLQEYDPNGKEASKYTGKDHEVTVTYIMKGSEIEFPISERSSCRPIMEDHVIMSIKTKEY